METRYDLLPAVAQAQLIGRGVVALETTVIAHGLPAPLNVETAHACEQAVRVSGAQPATIGILAGQPKVGLSQPEIAQLAAQADVVKVNLANLGATIAQKRWGATTVASTMYFAHRANIRVFSTGGIGGVHRGATESFDISADLTALAKFPVMVVCAGAKAILDLPKTLEVLETYGVPVIGYQTNELPAFYSRTSGLKLDLRADTPAAVAAMAKAHWQLGFTSGVLVVVPVPEPDAIPSAEIESFIAEALRDAAAHYITGKDVTPFLLSHIAARTEGRALRANIALLQNNARLAGEISQAMN
ncbi:MAG: pseudouridine-5'-phosphate glycosidase [Acidobacteria bacterium]|nr:pseudouridine-5'-phosphate glycosidase [Acidobacteriota bacterium]